MHPDRTVALGGGLITDDTTDRISGLIVRLAVAAAFAVMAMMSFTRNINWDEFYFLSHVHAHLGGHLDRPLQTFFVHGFGWLDRIAGTEVDQIAVARLIMLAFFAATCFSLHRIARRVADPSAADMAVLAFVTSGFAIAHGNSFRADPMAASLLMGALAIMITTRMGPLHILAVALLSALAVLVTVKAALYLPVFIAALLWRWEAPGVVLRCVAAGVLALIIAGGLFFWHASGITPAEGAAASENLNEAARVSLGGSGFLPRWPELLLWLFLSLGAVLLAAAGLRAAPTNRIRFLLLLCAGPLLAVLIYRNAFVYFFPFAVPPLMIAVALGAQATRGRLIWKLALVLMLATGSLQGLRALSETNATQRATIAEVHRLFPEPVPYIDQNGMLSSFDRQGFFMSTWGLATYRAGAQPVFADIIAQHQPPLLMTNRNELHAALRPHAPGSADVIGLLPEDVAVLRNTYVHYAGVIWLAGHEGKLAEPLTVVDMPIAGPYRVTTSAPVTLNGASVSDGEVINLPSGPIRIEGAPGTALRLMWNTGTGPAPQGLPETGLYAGFWRL